MRRGASTGNFSRGAKLDQDIKVDQDDDSLPFPSLPFLPAIISPRHLSQRLSFLTGRGRSHPAPRSTSIGRRKIIFFSSTAPCAVRPSPPSCYCGPAGLAVERRGGEVKGSRGERRGGEAEGGLGPCCEDCDVSGENRPIVQFAGKDNQPSLGGCGGGAGAGLERGWSGGGEAMDWSGSVLDATMSALSKDLIV